MGTKKIGEAIRQLFRDGDRPLRDAAAKELGELKRALRDVVRHNDSGEVLHRDVDRAWSLIREIAAED